MKHTLKLNLALLLGLFSNLAMAESAIQTSLNHVFEKVNGAVAGFLFMDIFGFPLIIAVMVSGGLFFTLRYGFINIKMFKHAIDVLRGKYDDPNHEGEITHFQALSSALSATVGLGNIAGVAVAIQVGGPGAVFWLWLSAFFGMSMKFSSCTFAQLYREVDPKDGSVIGGPMIYLKKGFTELYNLPAVGKFLGALYAVLAIMASFGGGNMFQGNQTYELLSKTFPSLQGMNWIVGIVLAFFAAIVLLGGIKRIASVTSKMVPIMCGFYVLTCSLIILKNVGAVPSLIYDIFAQAFAPDAVLYGSLIGVLIQGVKRASFSNEAGVGSAAIAHAAAKTDEPVREGIVAMIGPFIDTHIVCTMTSLAVLITGAHLVPENAGKGAQITAYAFGSLHPFFATLLTIAAVIFAYSTIISWSYYGEKGWQYLFGKKSVTIYRVIYVCAVVMGPVLTLGAVLEFSDLMLLFMAFPNIIGMMFLSKRITPLVKDYVHKLKSNQFKVFK
jgi:AGCS family alanine or glycine:cation symporter